MVSDLTRPAPSSVTLFYLGTMHSLYNTQNSLTRVFYSSYPSTLHLPPSAMVSHFGLTPQWNTTNTSMQSSGTFSDSHLPVCKQRHPLISHALSSVQFQGFFRNPAATRISLSALLPLTPSLVPSSFIVHLHSQMMLIPFLVSSLLTASSHHLFRRRKPKANTI